MISETTRPIRAYESTEKEITAIWKKRMGKWKRGEKRPTVSDLVKEAWDKAGITK